MTRHVDPLGNIEKYLYDLCGNRYRDTTTQEGKSQGRTLAFPKGVHYQLDRAGSLITRACGERKQYLRWNGYGNLTELDNHRYGYDALGRRVFKQTGPQNCTWFFWEGDALAAEVTPGNKEKISENKDSGADIPAETAASDSTPDAFRIYNYFYYLYTFIPLALQTNAHQNSLINDDDKGFNTSGLVENNALYFYQNEINGAPLKLVDRQGDIVWAACYDASGKARRLDKTDFHQPLRLQGQYFDDESGLHYNRYRYYDPETGIFISQDPIGLLGGLNPYQFAPNVLGWIDPLGLEKRGEDSFPAWMDKKPTQERHHIIPWSLRDHPIMQKSNRNVNNATNMMYLPRKEGNDPNYPNAKTHANFKLDGKHHNEYNKEMKAELDRLNKLSDSEKWSQDKIDEEILNLQNEKRSELKGGGGHP